jgi:hypothetical protein
VALAAHLDEERVEIDVKDSGAHAGLKSIGSRTHRPGVGPRPRIPHLPP